MPKKAYTKPILSVLGISDLDVALSLAGASHDQVMAFSVTPVDFGRGSDCVGGVSWA